MAVNTRRPMNGSTARPPSLADHLVQAHSLQTDEAVRVGLEALQVDRMREEELRVIEVDDVAVGEVALERLTVEVVALLHRACRPGGVEQLVDLRVTVARLVEPAVTGVEGVDVAVGVDTAGPADREGEVLALLLKIEGRGELG